MNWLQFHGLLVAIKVTEAKLSFQEGNKNCSHLPLISAKSLFLIEKKCENSWIWMTSKSGCHRNAHYQRVSGLKSWQTHHDEPLVVIHHGTSQFGRKPMFLDIYLVKWCIFRHITQTKVRNENGNFVSKFTNVCDQAPEYEYTGIDILMIIFCQLRICKVCIDLRHPSFILPKYLILGEKKQISQINFYAFIFWVDSL